MNTLEHHELRKKLTACEAVMKIQAGEIAGLQEKNAALMLIVNGLTRHAGPELDAKDAEITALKAASVSPVWPTRLTDEQVIQAIPGGLIDCLLDPWDCGVGDGDETRSIKADIVRVARAVEARYGIGPADATIAQAVQPS